MTLRDASQAESIFLGWVLSATRLASRIAGAVVANDSRFVADAIMARVPPREPRKRGMDAAVLMMVSSELPDMVQPNISDIIPGRRNDAYVVTLEGSGITL